MTDYEEITPASIDAAIRRIKQARAAQAHEDTIRLSEQWEEANREMDEEREMREEQEQARFLLEHGDYQISSEASFCWGIVTGAAVSLSVFTVTLKILGVI